jgi:2-keto-4-pentenoate hydratase/2-oxohepta-3-ene-1,7-dioic acid hydratase in catechol pathway
LALKVTKTIDILIHSRSQFNPQNQGGKALKVLTYRRADENRAGILLEDTVYDIQTCCSFFNLEEVPCDLLALLCSGRGRWLEQLHGKLLESRQSRMDLPLRCWAVLDEVRICAPIARPPKLICLGRNYRDHIEEQSAKTPQWPLLFCKASTAVIGPGQPIVIPTGSRKVDYEGELALVVGARLKNAGKDQAAKAIFGYTCLNDVTEREAQFSEKQWYRAKSMDTFAPLGPWIVTSDEIQDPLNLGITTKVNSEIRQSESTAQLIFTPPFLMSFISRTMTLEPGDVISTGTPGGVGVFRDPPVFLKAGDTVEITIDRIGTLFNPVVGSP